MSSSIECSFELGRADSTNCNLEIDENCFGSVISEKFRSIPVIIKQIRAEPKVTVFLRKAVSLTSRLFHT